MAALAISVLFFAEGYRLNLANMRVVKTGIFFAASDPKGATIYLNNKKLDEATPHAENLPAGYYNAKVESPGYVTWTTSFHVSSGLVTDFEDIILFKEKPEISNLTDQRKIDLLNSLIERLAINNDKNPLIDNGYEIWQNDKLVTRFSTPIENVIWYPDMNHIVYQQGSQIRVIEKTGLNDTLLVTLSDTISAHFTLNNRGDELYFLDNGQYKMAKIR